MNEGSRKTSNSEALHERLARDGADSLTAPERTFRAVEEFDILLFASGFEEFFLGLSQMQIARLQDAFATIGAFRTRTLVAAASNTVGDCSGLPGSALPDFLSSERGSQFSALVSQLQEYPDHLRELRDAYADLHAKEFLGPKTQLDLWRSRRHRGEQTAPKRVAVVLSHEAERQRDSSISTRACPECGYPSPDYRRTCKSCGFPHGAKE